MNIRTRDVTVTCAVLIIQGNLSLTKFQKLTRVKAAAAAGPEPRTTGLDAAAPAPE